MAFACEHQYATVGAGIIPFIMEGKLKPTQRFMLVKRANTMDLHGGQWGVIGGYWRIGAEPDPATALVRESNEEVGQAFMMRFRGTFNMGNIAYVRPNVEPNSLFGKHPDAREEHANLHFLWAAQIGATTYNMADISADTEGENTAKGLFTLGEIQEEPDKFVPWLPQTLQIMKTMGKI